MDKQEVEARVTHMVAHQTPEEMARKLVYLENENKRLQTDNDAFLFSKERADQELAQGQPNPPSGADDELGTNDGRAHPDDESEDDESEDDEDYNAESEEDENRR